MKIQDMTMDRRQAMNCVMDLAPKFVKCFNKTWRHPQSRRCNHCANKMQMWLDQILGIKLKETGKSLSLQQKMDWFFTNGSDSETLFKDRAEAMVYDDFIEKVVFNNDVKKSLSDVGLL